MKAISLCLLVLLTGACASKDANPMIDPIMAKQRLYRQCYLESDSYKNHAHIETGTVSIAFTVDPRGHVKAERIIHTDFTDANLHACVLGITEQIVFPEPDNKLPVEISQTINFSQSVE